MKLQNLLHPIKTRLAQVRLTVLVWPLGLAAGLFLAYMMLFALLPGLQESASKKYIKHHRLSTEQSYDSVMLEKETNKLAKRLASAIPGGAYMVINTTNNHYWLYKNKELLREGQVSTGSYIQLVVDESKNWIFKTPRGVQTIKGKITDPVWRKPDWAFIEEGLPVPSATHPSRYEYGVLGDYALSLGDGYLIHGTLYQRLMGLPVTHGCIRMADDDLEEVFKTLQVGSKVLIY